MAVQVTALTAAMAVTTVVSLVALLTVYPHRDRRGALPLLSFLFGTLVWSLAQTLQVASTALAAKVVWYKTVFLGATVVPAAYLLVTAAVTDRDRWLRRPLVDAVVAVELSINVLVWTNPVHGQLLGEPALTTAGSLSVLDPSFGPLFYLHAGFQYLLVSVGLYWLAVEYWDGGQDHSVASRRQLVLLAAAALAPAGANIAFLAGVTDIEFTPFAFALTASLVAVALLRYQLLGILSIARDTVVETMESAVLVVGSGRVVDLNPSASALLEASPEVVTGQPLEEALSAFPEVVETIRGDRETTGRLSVTRNGTDRHYVGQVTPITDAFGNEIGQTIVFSDITDQVEREAELRRKNRQLDRFAAVVSHDLRSPLNVAKGRTTLLEEEYDSEHIEPIQEAHEEMETLVENLLTLAREGEGVSETEPVDLADLAQACWDDVRTETATLVVDTERTLRADPTRFKQLLKNLVQNAVDHSGPGVTVTVGDFEKGFYVEDDGPGIPVNDREAVFEASYSGAEDGTGVGLSIVEEVAEAHGWTVEVTDGADGGARFEVHVEN